MTDINPNPEWWLRFALPNIDVKTKLPESRFLAIVAPNDKRVRFLYNKYPNIRSYLKRFRDQFKKKFRPSLLICSPSAPNTVSDNIESFYAFRDALSISVIAEGCQSILRNDRRIGWEILYSDYFDFYPVNLGRNYEDIVIITQGSSGLHEIESFSGQSSPKLFRSSVSNATYDQYFLNQILAGWNSYFVLHDQSSNWSQLFRSLAMAFHGCALSHNNTPLLHDYGVILGSWVSAFEVLVHPGPGGKSNFWVVSNLLDCIKWNSKKLKLKKYVVNWKRKPYKVTLASKIYWKILEARNKFLHGEKIIRQDLLLTVKNYKGDNIARSLLWFAPIIYRGALLNFLSKGQKVSRVGSSLEQFSNNLLLEMKQDNYEEALNKIINCN